MRALDLTGQRFGKLVAVEWTGVSANGGRTWKCRCDCGRETVAPVSYLRSGNTTSCGCGQREAASRTCRERATHGECGTRLYNIWCTMRARCNRATSISYPYYGERGITVCEAWSKDYTAFSAWAMANGYAANLTIDRIDSTKGYEPDNCQFISLSENVRKKDNVHVLTHDGETLPLSVWAARTGIGRTTLKYRLANGWPVKIALSMPPSHGNKLR